MIYFPKPQALNQGIMYTQILSIFAYNSLIKYRPTFKGATFISYVEVKCLSLLHTLAK